MTIAILAGPARARTPPRGAFRWGASFAVALALHLAGALALFMWRAPIVSAPSPPPAAVMIDLAPLPAAPAPAAPPVPVPAPVIPPPQEVRPQPAPAPVPVPLPPRKPVEHRPVPRPIRPPKPAPPAPAETTPMVVPAPAPVAAAPAPAPQARPSVAANGLPSFESLLAAHLDRYKRYPRAAQTRGEQGVAYLRFTMDRQGRVLAYRLERSSGHAALDEEVLALIRRAEPLPPIPATIASAQLEIVVPVRFSLR